jgi:hypothetical protein
VVKQKGMAFGLQKMAITVRRPERWIIIIIIIIILERDIKAKNKGHKTEAVCLELCSTQSVNHWRSRHVEKLGIALSIGPNSADIPHRAPADRNRPNLQNIPLIFGTLNS